MWIVEGKMRALHDLSDGGLAVAAAEMAFGGGGLGIDLDVAGGAADLHTTLFGEGPHRFLAEVRASDVDEIVEVAAAREIPVRCIGETNSEGILRVRSGDTTCIEKSVEELKSIWKSSLEATWPTP